MKQEHRHTDEQRTHRHGLDTHPRQRAGWIRRFVRWFLGSPFRALPPEFGDPVPPDLRVFAAEVDEIRHEVHEIPAPPGVHAGKTKAARIRSMPKGG
jgi:hypothetical protein